MSLKQIDSPALALAWLTGAVVLALLVAEALRLAMRGFARRSAIVAASIRRGRPPLRLTLVLLAIRIVLAQATGADAKLTLPDGWRPVLLRIVEIGLIASIAWLVGVLAFVAEDLAMSRFGAEGTNDHRARRVRTQVSVVRRLTVLVLAVLTVVVVLMTFPSARVAGASILASAGVVGIVAGLAAQTSLANLFAGLQLAFSDALLVDDVVVVGGEWGRIEEITLTYVVVHVWDDRRLVIPSTHFTTNIFENWTRQTSAILGVVEFDVDWTLPIEAMRAEMRRLLDGTDLWDRRVGVLQVTDAVSSFVRVRILVSGNDGPTVFDLRCLVREGLVGWLQREHPYALPRLRTGGAIQPPVQREPAEKLPARPLPPEEGEENARLFTGSMTAIERSRVFGGPEGEAAKARAARSQQAEREARERAEAEDASGDAAPRRHRGDDVGTETRRFDALDPRAFRRPPSRS